MFLAAAICTVVCYRATSLGGRFVAALAGAGVLIGLSLAIFGFDRVSNRLEDFSSASLQRLDARRLSKDHLGNDRQSRLPSPSAGNRRGEFQRSLSHVRRHSISDGREPTHAENGYLQVLLETGVVGLALVLTGIVVCASWCAGGIRASVPTRVRVCAAAIAASLAAFAVHALVDFVWYVPALHGDRLRFGRLRHAHPADGG